MKHPFRPATRIVVSGLLVKAHDLQYPDMGAPIEAHPAKRHVRLEFEVWASPRGPIVRIQKGGATGHESATIAALVRYLGEPWEACSGTPGRWDRLVVPAESVSYLVRAAQALVAAGVVEDRPG